MTHDEIIAYAKQRGAKKVRLKKEYAFGHTLYGVGRAQDGWPLVWAICDELGMGFGCGGVDWHQCRPERAKLPNNKGNNERA